MRVALSLAVACLLASAGTAAAAVTEASAHADDDFDFMNLLAKHRLHDLENEHWNAYGQLTWISSFKLPYSARYTNKNGSTNSLSPEFEHSFTGTITLYLGAKLWRGSEIYWVPEMITERPLTHLVGLGGVIQNFELQKQGGMTPIVYSSRLYFRQTFGLGGKHLARSSDPLQLGTTIESRRLVFTLGNFSVLDFFDKNSFAGDLRRQFFNMAFLTYAAYDFAADARGYTDGGAVDFIWDDWAVRFAHALVPKNPNQLALDTRFWQYYGDQIELEHSHQLRGLPGVVRVLGYRNHEKMGRFDEASAAFQSSAARNATTCTGFNYGSQNASAPDLCWARRPQTKWGVGLNLEQNVFADIGVFVRAMYSDGRTEVYSFTSTDRSLSFGVLGRGSLWRRPHDYAGAGFSVGWISRSHAHYLAQGGVDGFIGDGGLKQAAESVFEAFYGVAVLSSVWLSADYQLISNPAYNADRGHVHILGARAHAEF